MRSEMKQSALRIISSSLYRQQVAVFLTKYELKITNLFNLQSDFTTLQGAPCMT